MADAAPLPFGEQIVVVPEPNAESVEFSRECETDGDREPVDGGLKNESGNLRIRNGTANGCFESDGLSTLSNNACKLSSEFSSMRTTKLSLFVVAVPAPLRLSLLLVLLLFVLLALAETADELLLFNAIFSCSFVSLFA